MTMQLDDIAKHSATENKINWVTATFMALFHVGAVVALFFFTSSLYSSTGCRGALESAWGITDS
jgi:hypothetical protein